MATRSLIRPESTQELCLRIIKTHAKRRGTTVRKCVESALAEWIEANVLVSMEIAIHNQAPANVLLWPERTMQGVGR